MPPVGLLLAAGAGVRFGGPKALAETGGVPWVVASARVLRDGGCDPVVVVVGAAADLVTAALEGADGPGVVVVEAPDWSDGMGASLRAGLAALADLAGAHGETAAVLVHLVDLPDVGSDVVARVAALASPDVVARASFRGAPGHPVLIGRDHWAEAAAAATGDRGARDLLARHEATLVECSDLATGQDVDRPGPMLER